MTKRKTFQILTLVSLLCTSLLLSDVCKADPPTSWPSWKLATVNQGEFHSRSLEGKVVVMTMWASWCPSCRKQLPVMDRLYEDYQDRAIQVLNFSFDHSENSHEQYVRDLGLETPSVFARNGEGLRVVKLIQQGAGTLEAVPTVLIWDKNGRLAHRLVGFSNRKQLEELIEPLLVPRQY